MLSLAEDYSVGFVAASRDQFQCLMPEPHADHNPGLRGRSGKAAAFECRVLRRPVRLRSPSLSDFSHPPKKSATDSPTGCNHPGRETHSDPPPHFPKAALDPDIPALPLGRGCRCWVVIGAAATGARRHCPIPLVVHDWAARLVDGQLLIVDANAVALRVWVRH
jgi:hypothetical protein